LIGAPVCIVTGAGSGIGRTVAVRCAQRGMALVLVGRRRPPLEATRDAAPGSRSAVVDVDVSADGAPDRIVGAALDAFGRIDVVVNNAAVAPVAALRDSDAALLADTLRVNAIAPAQLVRAAWPALCAAPAGRVVNVSSMATIEPFPGFTAYAMSKAAIESLTRSIAVEGADAGVRAFSVAPGAVWTDMLRSVVPDFPRERALDADTVAEVIVACAAGDRDEDAGQVIVVAN
jgi:NAD(P)-dependent dehydrogenase (short-subunit alcohol dehydrogenase family)